MKGFRKSQKDIGEQCFKIRSTYKTELKRKQSCPLAGRCKQKLLYYGMAGGIS